MRPTAARASTSTQRLPSRDVSSQAFPNFKCFTIKTRARGEGLGTEANNAAQLTMKLVTRGFKSLHEFFSGQHPIMVAVKSPEQVIDPQLLLVYPAIEPLPPCIKVEGSEDTTNSFMTVVISCVSTHLLF